MSALPIRSAMRYDDAITYDEILAAWEREAPCKGDETHAEQKLAQAQEAEPVTPARALVRAD